MDPALTDIPSLKRGCRLSAGSTPMLLIPEGALHLYGPGKRIVELCDGKHNLDDVIRQLQIEYSSVDASRILGDVVAFLKGLQDKGAIEFL